ncbi:MAG: PAS domain S-box protein [Chloroflexi bacterium]|nr:PAS domain S-box protein [Chloroflexota bacterium]
MRFLKNNQLLKLSFISFLVIAAIAGVLVVATTVGLNNELGLLGEHEEAVQAGTTIDPSEPFSITSIKDDINDLRWMIVGLLVGGLVILCLALMYIFRNLVGTIDSQKAELVVQAQEIEDAAKRLNKETEARLALEREQLTAVESLSLSENKYRSLVNQSPDMIFISRIDDFRLTEANDRACEFYGYSQEEFLELDIFDLEMEPPLRQDVRSLYDNTPVGQVVEVYGTNKKKDGSTFPVHVRFAKLDETLAIANVRDITDQREVERMKDGFISTVSHELRTPLTSIKSAAEILLNYGDEDRKTQEEFLVIINRESDRLTRLINDVLDISRLESGQMNWDWAKVDIADVVHEAVNGTKALLMQRDLSIQSDLDSDLPFISNDRDRMLQILTNLLGNSIKFTPDGGKVLIKARKLDPDEADGLGEKLEISVTDTGIGIQPSDYEIIFQKFRQAGNNSSDSPTGTGLGLNICKEIVEYTGGNIWVESVPGKGSTFFFTVPIAPTEQATTPA